jgi:ketosteroid isomerase-like protein
VNAHPTGERKMASREAMIETIHQAYDARDKSDIEGLMAAFHPNAVFELKGEKDIVEIAGAVQGHSNLRAAMTALIETFEFVKRDIVEAIVEGDRAAVRSRATIRFTPKDIVVTTDILDMFRFEDGKITELVEFADTALIKSLVGG